MEGSSTRPIRESDLWVCDLDVRYGARGGTACAEFSWEGHDETDPICGRCWVEIGTAGRLIGHFYMHSGDESGFVCEPD